MYKVLMVCLGNICRSPLAQGILEKKSKENNLKINIDSAGTSGWHISSKPDQRSIDVAKKFNIDISQQRARKFTTYDFKEYDKIYVMDTSNYRELLQLCSEEKECYKIALILADKDQKSLSVPDPYYGQEDGFIKIYKLLDVACQNIVNQLQNNE